VRSILLVVFVGLALVGGCASREELIAKSATIPHGVDLSGQWRLRVASQDTVKRIKDAELRAAGGEKGIQIGTQEPRRSGRRSLDGTLVHVFLETGSALKITQTEFGLFISFDRAVVEEYRFGEKRQISVGAIEADRVSGWQGDTYIIETLDMEGAKLVETYRLDDAGRTLIRSIVVIEDDARQVDVTQAFDRA
jgi:hypothetical protein